MIGEIVRIDDNGDLHHYEVFDGVEIENEKGATISLLLINTASPSKFDFIVSANT